MAGRIDAAEIARPYRERIRHEIESRSLSLRLVGFLANQDDASRSYAEWTARDCADDGIRYDLREVDRLELEDEILKANRDPEIHGIIVYYPVFGGTMDGYIRDTVSLEKDVEGLSHVYRYNLYHNIRYLDPEKRKKSILPCTPLGIVKILDHVGALGGGEEPLAGTTATVINRSEVVGRPLAAMLSNDGARVFSVDISSILKYEEGRPGKTDKTVEEAVRAASIVVTGVPTAEYELPLEWIREESIVIDFSSHQNVDPAVAEKATFIPSVGRMTIAMLERNLLRLYDNFHS